VKLVGFTLVLALFGCSDRDHAHASATEVAPDRTPRVLDPPPQNVRALPPHAIHADGVGPYRLGVTLERLGTQIPSGGRNAQVDIPNVVHLSVLHAEEDAILIGGEPLGRATFVAVVGPQIARTETGIQVGSTRDELVHALGAPSIELDRWRDPRVIVPSNLRELRAVMDGDRVVGLVVAASEPPSKPEGCVRPAGDDKRIGACVTGTPELASLEGDELVVRTPEIEGKPGAEAKIIAKAVLPNAVFFGPVRAADGRDELVAITRVADEQSRTWSLVAFRWDAGHLLRVIDAPVYQLTTTNARWIGSTLRDLDLALEVVNRGDTFEVGGLLTRRSGDKLRDLLVLSPVQVPRKRAKPATVDVPSDAGVGDAGTTSGSDDVHTP
jgi:hypothetical protein